MDIKSKNILITVITVIMLGVGALVWIWNSEIGQPVVFENAEVLQPPSPNVSPNAAINSALDNIQIIDPAVDFQSVDSAAASL